MQKNLPGRKKKTKNMIVIGLENYIHTGWLKPSFIPEKSIREIKSITIYRNKLTLEE
jgi:hypothetical protein